MMKRRLLVVLTVVLSIFILPLTNDVAYAKHSLKELDIHVEIDEDGKGIVTERRVAHLSEGTENYIVIDNPSQSEITQFTVKENGQTFEHVDDWDLDQSREEKAGKSGIIETKNGYELAWGIGDYGEHEYELTYTITDMIKQLDDAQILYWQLVNSETNIPPEHLRITIVRTNGVIEDEEVDAFGFEGDLTVENGKLLIESNEALSSSQYATVLIKFAEGSFQTADIIDKDYENFMAENADKDSSSPLMIIGLIILIPFIIIMGFVMYFTYFRKLEKNYVPIDSKEYTKEIPFEGNPLNLVFLLDKRYITNMSDVFSMLLLRWMREGVIKVEEDTVGTVFKSESIKMTFTDQDYEMDEFEKELYDLLMQAVDENGILDEPTLKTFGSKHTTEFNEWFKHIKDHSRDYLVEQDYLEKVKRRFLFIPYTDYIYTGKGRLLVEKLHYFKHYLKDFSSYETDRVENLDELIIWSALLGVSTKALDQFRKVYPNFEKETFFYPYMITHTNSFSTNVISSSGGSSSISSGGGGGSFGGGAGGGTR